MKMIILFSISDRSPQWFTYTHPLVFSFLFLKVILLWLFSIVGPIIFTSVSSLISQASRTNKVYYCGLYILWKRGFIPGRFLVAKLLYNYLCPSVCPYVRPSVRHNLGGNVIFSAPNWDIAPISFCADSHHKWAAIL